MYKKGVFHVQIRSFFVDITTDLFYNAKYVQIRSFLNQYRIGNCETSSQSRLKMR